MLQIGEQISLARARQGLSQKELARALKISNVQISDIENGKVLPSVGVLKRLAETLDVSADDLLQDVHRNFIIYAIDDYISRLDNDKAFDILQILSDLLGRKP